MKIGDILKRTAPEPPPGTSVTDDLGRPWSRAYDQTDDGAANWTWDDVDADAESWVKVSGNYGPVLVTYLPDAGDLADPH